MLSPNGGASPCLCGAIATVYGIRSTSGHALAWPANFSTVVYQELYESLMDAILWTVERKYPQKNHGSVTTGLLAERGEWEGEND